MRRLREDEDLWEEEAGPERLAKLDRSGGRMM